MAPGVSLPVAIFLTTLLIKEFMKYDYYKAVWNDIEEYLRENYSDAEIAAAVAEDRDGFYEELYDRLWVTDSVTGNASGSYTFNAYEAGEHVGQNLDLLGEAVEEFGSDMDVLKNGAEACDVTIRCYLLGQTLSEILDNY